MNVEEVKSKSMSFKKLIFLGAVFVLVGLGFKLFGNTSKTLASQDTEIQAIELGPYSSPYLIEKRVGQNIYLNLVGQFQSQVKQNETVRFSKDVDLERVVSRHPSFLIDYNSKNYSISLRFYEKEGAPLLKNDGELVFRCRVNNEEGPSRQYSCERRKNEINFSKLENGEVDFLESLYKTPGAL